MKKSFTADGVTEYPPGPNLAHLRTRFAGTGAVVLCIDASGSMGGTRLDEAIKGGTAFIDDAAAGGYLVGLILWNTDVALSVAPTKDAADVAERLRQAEVSGGTALTPALREARSLLTATAANDQVCVVFTDGELFDTENAVAEAARLKATGIRILTIGLGDAAAQGLNAIASDDSPPTTTSTESSLAADIKGLATGLSVRSRTRS